jgi:glycosyltransferase involved in cell wall biosynthesis
MARRYEELFWKRPANIAVLDRLRDVEADVVVANDLRALAIALRLDAPVVYDAHEYAPEEFSNERWWRLLIAPHARWQCRRYLPRVAGMMTVSTGIAEAYERDTGVRATVVTSAPAYAALEPTPVHEPVRILHHGGAQPGRGLDEMLHIADLLDERFTLDFVLTESKPGYRDELIRRAHDKPNVRFPAPRPMHELAQMANEYDVGLFLLPPRNLNQRYVLPNKFFEYIQGRLAVAIGPSEEMATLVRQFGCGVVADDFDPKTMAAAINALDAATIEALKRASHAAARELCAERNSELVLAVVDAALARSAHRV